MDAVPAARPPTTSPRLFIVDGPVALRRRLAAHWPGIVREVSSAGEWWLAEAPDANDGIVLCVAAGRADDVAQLAAVHAVAPRVPILAWIGARLDDAEAALLAAGVHEMLRSPADLPRALGLARARSGLVADAARLSARPRGGADEGLFPNLYDWIYVVGVDESGGMTFETIDPPLHADVAFLDPAFEGRAPEACLPAPAAAVMRDHLGQVLAEGRPLQFEEQQSLGGRTRSFQTIFMPVRNKWGRIHRVAGISRDTTVLTEAQAALRASEERLAHALEGTQQGLWDWDLLQARVYRSPRWFEMLGLSAGDVDDSLEAGLARIHPDDRTGVDRAIRLHLDGHVPRFQAEYRIRTGTDDWLWLFDVGKVVRWSDDGRPARIAGLCTDITERRRAEESLRALVGGVVHEMRNPAFGIGVNLDALEATFGDEPRFRPFVGALRESCQRILNLMTDLRDYGEPRTLRATPCQLRTLLDDAVRSCQDLARERGCAVHITLEDDALVLPLHEVRMHQVFRNLLENALHHAPAGGTVRVSVQTELRVGHEWSVVSVEDEGPGFDAETLARAFEPFFTRRRGGTGLGLSIVKRVVEEHGGSVVAANRPGGGAALRVRLPRPRHAVPQEATGGQ